MKKRSVPVLHITQHDNKTEVVLAATGVWCVAHAGKPITLVVEKKDGKNWRYPKTVFTSPAFAKNLAKRLNVLFQTDAYGVLELSRDQ